MAGRQVRQALQDAHELRSFVISNIRPTGRQLGRGSYGSVEELDMDGLVCAGKTLYETLVDPENQGAQRMVDMYYRECKVLSELRHPHVVQFLGICFLPDSQLPVLVMERLQGSLDELLESTPDIALPTKLSILQDVARGLVYLHNHSPAIIHRDLSARNVLLNLAMTAKIADMGNSRIVDIPPGQLAQTMTRGIPGTLVYMPPEALGSKQKYGPSLDMFSFGQLSLFTAIQVFPRDLLTPTYYDALTDQVKGRTEVERRAQYMDTLHEVFDTTHDLVVLIKSCLEYEPIKRPTARQALERLGEMSAATSDPYSGLNRLQLGRCLWQKEEEVQQLHRLRSDLEQLSEELAQLREACRAKDKELAVKEEETREISQLKMEKASTDALIAARELEIAEKNHSLASLQQTCAALQAQLESLQTGTQSLESKPASHSASDGAVVAVKDSHIVSLQAQLREKEDMLQNKNKVPRAFSVLTHHLALKWKKPLELPSGVSRAQAVVVGSNIYIAGVEAETGVYKILEYSVDGGQSREIQTPACWFGMAAVGDQLIIAGGHDKEGDSNKAWALGSDMRTWVESFPEMPTARESPSAVGYGRWVVVVGGWGSKCVELLDTVSRQWYTALPLPGIAIRPSLTVIQDNLYVVWEHTIISVSIPALISHAMSQNADAGRKQSTPTKWQKLPNTLTKSPAITAFHGSLLAVGGETIASTIAMYYPQSEEWMKVAELPTPRQQCTCVLLSDTETLMVIGGRGKKSDFIKSVDLCTL